jgi:membrane protein implicated in regulation of membrane protease activity
MKGLIEVIYRFGTILIWGVAIIWAAGFAFLSFIEGSLEGFLLGLVSLPIAFVVHRGLRWILAPVRKDSSE